MCRIIELGSWLSVVWRVSSCILSQLILIPLLPDCSKRSLSKKIFCDSLTERWLESRNFPKSSVLEYLQYEAVVIPTTILTLCSTFASHWVFTRPVALIWSGRSSVVEICVSTIQQSPSMSVCIQVDRRAEQTADSGAGNTQQYHISGPIQDRPEIRTEKVMLTRLICSRYTSISEKLYLLLKIHVHFRINLFKVNSKTRWITIFKVWD